MSVKETQRAAQVAALILAGFEHNFRMYQAVTQGAKQRFELGQWQACQRAAKQRIEIYDQSLSDTVADLADLVADKQHDLSFWQTVKVQYEHLLQVHPQFELAETFYNSVIGRLFKHEHIDNSIMFILATHCHLPGMERASIVNTFATDTTVKATMEMLFSQYRFNVPFENYERDLILLVNEMKCRMTKVQLKTVTRVEILAPVFYRGKAAYLVGRICMENDNMPFIIALLLNDDNELYIDALLTTKRDLSILFGFARAYFMADTAYPSEVVDFLNELLPNKKRFELYISLGFFKHGKTEFYRNFLAHLDESDDQFEVAPGIRGLVMDVFHLPSYGVVFKIIKDEFGESKKITRDHVKDRYRLVKTHDRVGRMADTHEFSNFRLPKNRVSEHLLQELLTHCRSNVEVTDDEVIIKHLYIERRMTPLNIYLQQTESEPDLRRAIHELGQTIKEIAAANIFPGDMLHKNFGITRHGRVIFYDYDEICYMSERNFRTLPQSDDPYAMDTLSVAPDDVFPEQFEHFIVGKKKLKEMLKEMHPELLKPSWWQQVQQDVAQGDIIHVRPYSDEQCLKRSHAL